VRMVEHVNAKPTGVMKMTAVVSGLVSVIAHAVLMVDVSDPMLTTVMHVLRTHTVTNMETALATKDGPDVIVQSGSAPVEPVVLLVMAHVMTSALHVMDGQLCPRMALALSLKKTTMVDFTVMFTMAYVTVNVETTAVMDQELTNVTHVAPTLDGLIANVNA